MNPFAEFESRIGKILRESGLIPKSESNLPRFSVEPPRDPSHGDMACNAAMILSRFASAKPREIAEGIVEGLRNDPDVVEAEIAGPGFVNLRLSDSFWPILLRRILEAGGNYGASRIGEGISVNVEYVSANPTGPMHVGHCRGAVVGDALANLLEFAGYSVVREYVVNDAGAQIDILARSVWLRYLEALGEEIGTIPEGLYPGEYLIAVGEALREEFGDSLKDEDEAERMEILRNRAVDSMMKAIKEDLSLLGVEHDVFFSERSLHERDGDSPCGIERAIEKMRESDFVYSGTLPPPRGEKPDDWEEREQVLFRSTAAGDDMDRPLVKSDGSFTYFAADLAYFNDKFERGFRRMVYVLGADHGGYVKRLKAAAMAVSGGKAELDVLLCQLVRLTRDGVPVKMSKRAGDFVTLREVVEEVGSDAVRFMMLYRKSEAPLDFDFAKAVEQSKDNPVFYVQYAHARIASAFRQARRELPEADLSREALIEADLSLLQDEGEIGLIRKMSEYPRLIEQAARSDEPHRIAFHLHELASQLHQHWNRGNIEPALRFINRDEANLTLARLAMLRAAADIFRSALSIAGASAPEEMR